MERAVAVPHGRLGRVLALPRIAGWPALSVVVALSALVRTLVAFRRETPMYFPDEYMYSELGRSIATSGHPLVRGAESHFPALLQPVLTAPAWLFGDVATSYHVIQAGNAVAMSLAAVPVYLLARRVGVGPGLAVAVAAISLALPDLLYSGWILSEPFAYPLVLLAALLAVRALERPAARAQLAFLAVAGLAAFARAQLLVLPLCFLAAALLVAARERSLRRTLRGQWLVAGTVAAGMVAFLLRGDAHVGIYSQVLTIDLSPGSLAGRLETQLLALLYGSGWVLVPGAVLGLALALARPRSRAELAFGAFALPLVAGLLLQAALWGDTAQMQERYLFYAFPLLAVAFALQAERAWPWRRAHAVLCAALFLVAVTVPLSGYATLAGKEHATFLFAVTRAEELFGLGTGALVVAICAGALSLAAGLLAWSRQATVAVTLLAFAACAAAAGAATSFDLRYDAAVRRDYLPADPQWVDHAGVGDDVALVYGSGHPHEGLEQLFWNRSVRRVLLLPGAEPLDAFGADTLRIGADGTLLLAGRALEQPLLVDGNAGVIDLRGAERVAASQAYTLWRPAGTPRVAYYAAGWYRDGWLANAGSFRLWAPRIAGRISFTVHRAAGEPAATLSLRSPSGSRTLRVAPGTSRRIELQACGRGRWRASFGVDRLVLSAGRLLGMRATRPVWTPTATTCQKRRSRAVSG